MRITLARPHVGHSGPPVVHAFPGPADTDADSWLAVCGVQVYPGDVDIVEAFAGAPCMVCALSAATVSAAPALPRDEVDGPPIELDTMPQLPAEPDQPVVVGALDEMAFALSWRERIVHRATLDAPQVPYQGRTLVLGLCGALGWGPLSTAPDSSGWGQCGECEQISGVRA